MSELKTIVTQETKDLIDAAVERARTAVSSATTSAETAKTKATKARNKYNALLSEETLMEKLFTQSSLSQSEFLKIINAGRQSELSTGVVVTLNNSYGTTNQWVVADVNHDGTSGTVDLVAKNMIQDSTTKAYGGKWGGNNNRYESSPIRNWLTETYITGFSTTIQNALKTMDVKITGGTLQDKIKLLSMAEVGLTQSDWEYAPNVSEGTIYPIFERGTGSTAESKRTKYTANGGYGWYWTRSRIETNSTNVCYITSSGSYAAEPYTTTSGGIVPVIRF